MRPTLGEPGDGVRSAAGELVEQQRRRRRPCRAAPRSTPAPSAAGSPARRRAGCAAAAPAARAARRGGSRIDDPVHAEAATVSSRGEGRARQLAGPREAHGAGEVVARLLRRVVAEGQRADDERVGAGHPAVRRQSAAAVELREPAAQVGLAGEPGHRVVAGQLVEVAQGGLAPRGEQRGHDVVRRIGAREASPRAAEPLERLLDAMRRRGPGPGPRRAGRATSDPEASASPTASNRCGNPDRTSGDCGPLTPGPDAASRRPRVAKILHGSSLPDPVLLTGVTSAPQAHDADSGAKSRFGHRGTRDRRARSTVRGALTAGQESSGKRRST